MSDNHSHEHIQGKSNITVAFMLNFSFAIIEIIGGLITNSAAILSDAVHDFGDSLSLALSLIFEKISKKAPTNKFTYGYKRLSVIGAFINIIVLSIGTILVLKEAIESFANPKAVMAEGMFIMAILGILINGVSVYRMSGSKKILDKTVMMHLLEDLLGWIAVFMVSIVIYFTHLYILDSIISLVICIIIGRNIYLNIKNTIKIIMQAVPDQGLFNEIKDHLTKIKGVESVDKLNLWTLDGEEHVLTSIITIKQIASSNEVLADIKEMLLHVGIEESTIEINKKLM
ncbi:MAG: Cation transporter [Haloplasmataceae bacterium]|nr:Cation transporter [Haloplasmataceae bacterium]